MDKLEKLMSTKWVLFVASAVISVLAVSQELYLDGWKANFNIAALGVAISLCGGAFCELARMTMYKNKYSFVNVAVWGAAAAIVGILSLLIW